MNSEINEKYYRVISIIEKNPDYTQRKIAEELGYSLGKVNYVIASLVDKGIIKLQRFMKSKNKAGYRYVLTPHGIKEKYKITKAFIKRKITEYDKLEKEIEEAKSVLKNGSLWYKFRSIDFCRVYRMEI